jgi:hypothetical protein
MAADGVGETELLGTGKGGEGKGRGEGEAAGVEADAQLGGEAAGQRQAPLDPGLLAAEELGDGGGRETLLFKRKHDAGLIHGAEGLGGRVGGEETRLGGGAGDVLDDDGDLAESLAGPVGQALEAVEDLEGAVGGAGDAQGHRGQGAFAIGPRPPQGRPGGPQPVGRDVENEIHRGASSTGRSW